MDIALIISIDTDDADTATAAADSIATSLRKDYRETGTVLGPVVNDGQSWVGASVDDPEAEIAALEGRIAELRERVA